MTIYFTTSDAPTPKLISDHAVDRLIERYGDAFEFGVAESPGLRWKRARNLLEAITRDSGRYLESYEPSDLHGLGQAVWIGHSPHARIPVRFTVDGNGTVRTVLP